MARLPSARRLSLRPAYRLKGHRYDSDDFASAAARSGAGAGIDCRQFAGLGLGVYGVRRQRRADGRQPAGLGLWSAPRGGRRPYRGHRQRDPQNDAAGEAAFCRWRVVLAGAFVDCGAGFGGDCRDRHRVWPADELVSRDRQRYRHRRVGAVPAGDGLYQPGYFAQRLAQLSGVEAGRKGER